MFCTKRALLLPAPVEITGVEAEELAPWEEDAPGENEDAPEEVEEEPDEVEEAPVEEEEELRRLCGCLLSDLILSSIFFCIWNVAAFASFQFFTFNFFYLNI